MREIIFRAKRTNNGEWVEGKDIMHKTVRGKLCLANVGEDWVSVEPETFGQYTGLTDKNGKKIFEGDIVREYTQDINDEYDYDCFDCGRVFWYQQCSRFLRTSKWFPDDCPEITEYREYEVIGNIHDNPEILKTPSL